jgi:hypothetical protein
MKEFVNKLIDRLEELHIIHSNKYAQWNGAIDEVIDIVNELAEECKDDCCEWKFTKSVVDSGYFYSSGCNHKRFPDLHSFEFCPYCGKKIKVVE